MPLRLRIMWSCDLWEGLRIGACQPLDGVGHVQGQVLGHGELEGIAVSRAAEVDGHLGPVRADGDAAGSGLTVFPAFRAHCGAYLKDVDVVSVTVDQALLIAGAVRVSGRSSIG